MHNLPTSSDTRDVIKDCSTSSGGIWTVHTSPLLVENNLCCVASIWMIPLRILDMMEDSARRISRRAIWGIASIWRAILKVLKILRSNNDGALGEVRLPLLASPNRWDKESLWAMIYRVSKPIHAVSGWLKENDSMLLRTTPRATKTVTLNIDRNNDENTINTITRISYHSGHVSHIQALSLPYSRHLGQDGRFWSYALVVECIRLGIHKRLFWSSTLQEMRRQDKPECAAKFPADKFTTYVHRAVSTDE